MNRTFDVIVAGVGAMGSAACFHLARRGASVLGLEQFGVPHALGSSHGDSRIIRLCYFEHPDYVPLLRRAYELWRELQAEAGRQLLYETGGVYMGRPESDFVAATIRSAREHNLEHESLDRAQLHARFPQFYVPDDHVAVFEPHAGFLLPEAAIAAHAELALRRGAVVHGHEPVVSWQSDGAGVSVQTARGTYSADRIIFTGGAWSEKLLDDLGVKLTVTRQVLGWVWPKKPEVFALGRFPVWAIDNPDNTQHYGFPLMPMGTSARPGLKTAHHFHGSPTTPDAINRTPQPEDERDFRPTLSRLLPDADGPLLSMAVCMYTNSPDSHFIIDRHPRHKRAVIACGFSGHGFKFASVMGEVLADLALDGATRHPIGFLGLQRFPLHQNRGLSGR